MDPKFVNSDQNSIDAILEFYILTDNKFGILWTNILKCSLIIPYLNKVFKLWAVCSQHFVCDVFCEGSWGVHIYTDYLELFKYSFTLCCSL